MKTPAHPLLRPAGQPARVANVELFFDLVYVFAITQLSHHLLEHLTWLGVLQTATLWFAVWLGWQYTAWVSNWFNPEHLVIRTMLMVLMGVALLVSAAIPEAFGERGLLFACSFAAIQVGRTLFVLYSLGRGHVLTPNFLRMLCWLLVSAGLWIAGGLNEGSTRLALWLLAVGCEYLSPMAGFPVPGLGRSRTSDWTIDGGHLAERCQLFVIIALGESVLATGASFGQAAHPGPAVWLAFLVSFIGCVAMWWMYFDTSSGDAAHVIEHSDDPGRLGAYFHYVHVLLIAGVIVCAVADDLVVAHPLESVKAKYAAVLVGGPLVYLLGNALFKRVVYGRFPLSHTIGIGVLLAMWPVLPRVNLLVAGALTTTVMVLVTVWAAYYRRHGRGIAHAHTPG
ncbi:low temperature requirement protein A [Pseudoxanthomonas sp. PXM02]|uniref:low temperature requirement protein A n=1 Tax=Pseudoxanthomonas sp. PXM02 TaxID=2769294 RepID=UPI00177CB402|nr:low temperature requirement protein A [Pseudoxanthomonas sp. PXM02]MBD9481250.1 low temperature requirement protein A [Pseudoxanthomonas sp. PXM02]